MKAIVHTEKALIEATKQLQGKGSKAAIFSTVFSNTGGAARRQKLEKIWKRLRKNNVITSDKYNKKYWLEVAA